MRVFFAWLAVFAHVLLGGSAAGAITCFGADGHVAIESPYADSAIGTNSLNGSVQASRHGPCVDVSLSSAAMASDRKALSNNDAHNMPVPPATSSPLVAPAIFVRDVFRAAPMPRGASLEFAETVRLLI